MKPSPLENAEVHLAETGQKVSIEIHKDFKDSIASPSRKFDEIDELVEELRKAEFEERGARP